MVASNDNGNGHHADGTVKPKKHRPAIDPHFMDPGGVAREPARMPGWDGLPFKGEVPFLREGDHIQPQMGYTVHSDVFVMSDVEDLEYYNAVYQQAANGFALISADERRWDEGGKTWYIFLRWAVPYSYVPKKDEKEQTNGQVR